VGVAWGKAWRGRGVAGGTTTLSCCCALEMRQGGNPSGEHGGRGSTTVLSCTCPLPPPPPPTATSLPPPPDQLTTNGWCGEARANKEVEGEEEKMGAEDASDPVFETKGCRVGSFRGDCVEADGRVVVNAGMPKYLSSFSRFSAELANASNFF